MNHDDHVFLLHDGIPKPGGIWADLGAGTGAFTLALAECIGTQGTLYALDHDKQALAQLIQRTTERFPDVSVHAHPGDFRQPLDLPRLDGIVMANALHFVRDKLPVLTHLRAALKPGGRLILVEYDTDRGNHWVPYPMTYDTWQRLAAQAGLRDTVRLATRPSSFLGGFFSALSINPSKQVGY